MKKKNFKFLLLFSVLICALMLSGYEKSLEGNIEELENNTGKKYSKLYIVGGGAKNEFLNDLTRSATGKEVIALPIEATSLGNLKSQME